MGKTGEKQSSSEIFVMEPKKEAYYSQKQQNWRKLLNALILCSIGHVKYLGQKY